jgi:hypothetical protein
MPPVVYIGPVVGRLLTGEVLVVDAVLMAGEVLVVAGDWTGGICDWDLTGGRMLGVGH